MSYVFAAIAVVLWCGLFMGSVAAMLEGFDEGEKGFIIGGVVGLVIAIALVIWMVDQPNTKPCVRHETMMQYNAATKTTMPVRYCAQYGEWVKP